eukprot:CAMPEP_0194540348 /NCGR_PEP_ID=MMETSP0253-20130528/80518_1 /TAXON_ID=2966 /ORGANISM="Noctiluca scintillans" /LENGTH=173 /DNA_ID=CAMNT_0039386711 /DNA_START=70 /DNA_END=591 /DNA_ORIENTATION=-
MPSKSASKTLSDSFLMGVESDATEILCQAGNSFCVDCDNDCSVHPWTSLTYGVVLCLACAGRHRSLGVHLSVVRSLTLDTIKESETAKLLRSGNARLRAFLQDPETVGDEATPSISPAEWFAMSLEDRYESPTVQVYRRLLAAECDDYPSDAQPTTSPLSDAELRATSNPRYG